MRSNHSTASTSKCIITDSDTTYHFCRILRDSGRRKQPPAIGRLPQRKASLSATGHIFDLCIFTDSYTTALASIVINTCTIADSYITRSRTGTVRIRNTGTFANGYVFRLWCIATRTDSYTVTAARCHIHRSGHI